jgi:hypothetical protein
MLIIWNLSPQIKYVNSFCHPDKTMVYILYLNYCVGSFLVEETGVPEESTDLGILKEMPQHDNAMLQVNISLILLLNHRDRTVVAVIVW